MLLWFSYLLYVDGFYLITTDMSELRQCPGIEHQAKLDQLGLLISGEISHYSPQAFCRSCSGFQQDLLTVGKIDGHRICHKQKQQVADLCFPSTRPQGLESGCLPTPIGSFRHVCLSYLCSDSCGHQLSEVHHHSYNNSCSFTLAVSWVVSRPSVPVDSQTNEVSSTVGFLKWTTLPQVLLHAWKIIKCYLKKRGFLYLLQQRSQPVEKILLRCARHVVKSFVIGVVEEISLQSRHCSEITWLLHCHPVSNFTFIYKVIAWAMLDQLWKILEENKIVPVHQSAYRKLHSAEIALCKIYNDLVIDTCQGQTSLLIILNLSAAFDTVDLAILMEELFQCGIRDSALALLKSCLEN